MKNKIYDLLYDNKYSGLHPLFPEGKNVDIKAYGR